MRQHILSLNIALYQSYDAPWALTPRYYLENQTWTKPRYQEFLKDFFDEVGFDPDSIAVIYSKAESNLPSKRGIIYQIFIEGNDYHAIDKLFYVAKSGGIPIKNTSPTDLLLDYNQHSFPQLRMVLNAKSTLNPFYKIIMRRHDDLSSSQRTHYEKTIKEELKKLAIDTDKLYKAKLKLLQA